jgi:hypothetical protein
MRVGVLAPEQSRFERAKSFLSKEDAEFLLSEMIAERISSKLIRLFAADSPFRCLRPTRTTNFIQLPPREVENCFFVPPRTDKRPRLATMKAGWDWKFEPIPEDLITTAPVYPL